MSQTKPTDLERFTAACDYPGRLDPAEIERQLALYLSALGVERKIKRLPAGWTLDEHPSLARYGGAVLDDFAKRRGIPIAARDARAASAARDAIDARDAIAARDASDARDARDARAASAARDAIDARAARAASAARDAIDARAARDASAARDAIDARDAIAARDAIDARDARDARAASAARDAIDARAARAASAARDAIDARDARDASAARDAIDARDAIAARDAIDAIDARAASGARAASDARDARDARAASDARDARAARAASDARDARAARAAIDARDASAAAEGARGPFHRFVSWCIQSYGWWYWRFDLSYISTTLFGAQQINKPDVEHWSAPLLEAFVAGCWILHWTEDTLYWVAKPTVHKEVVNGNRRLHNDRYAALESDVENLYFWHGVLVPAVVVVRPDWITMKHITDETNAEVRRIMIERYGEDRYITDSGMEPVATDERFGDLFVQRLDFGRPIARLRVTNRSPEPDGSFRKYFLPINPDLYGGDAGRIPQAAVASTWRTTPAGPELFFRRYQDYNPVLET